MTGNGTSRQTTAVVNTGGSFEHGVESSAGASVFTGSTAYASVIGSQNSTPLQFGTNGAIRATLDTSGRLGIGTTSPGELLHVNGNAIIEDRLLLQRLQSSDNLSVLTFSDTLTGSKGNNLSIGNPGGYDLLFHTGGAEKARIDSSGRLLVGTSTQQGDHYLQIQGSSTASSYPGSIFLRRGLANASIGSGNQLGVIDFGNQDGGKGATIAAEGDAQWGTNDYPGRLVFSTTADGASSPTERMRIRNDGEIMINTTTSRGARLNLDGTASAASCDIGVGANGNNAFSFRNASNSYVGSINVTASATAFNTSSDYRLKENVTAVTDGITRLQQLKPSRFNLIADPNTTVDGFIAHEVQTVVPEAISGEKDAVDDEGNHVYQGIDQSKLVPLLTAALQEAIGEIEKLKARVVALESKP